MNKPTPRASRRHAREVGLAIALDIECRDLDSSSDRLLENAGANGLTFDRDVAWEGNIDGQELHGKRHIVVTFVVCVTRSPAGHHVSLSLAGLGSSGHLRHCPSLFERVQSTGGCRLGLAQGATLPRALGIEADAALVACC